MLTYRATNVTPKPLAPYVHPVSERLSHVERERMADETGELLEILSWCRPDQMQAETDFVKRYVMDLRAIADVFRVDGFGNVWVTVDAAPDSVGPNILFSCHTDTMHASGGRQSVAFKADGQTLGLVKAKPGRCLGADDGAGLWLMREMIRAGVAGSYVFHRAEEVGRKGSGWVAKNEAKRLASFDACIAFDRKGTDNLITHQMGERGISKAFTSSFIAALGEASDGALDYRADDTGSFTDSYSYFQHISECCNVSIGYAREHGPAETLDVAHVWKLRNAMVKADLSGLVIERDPSVTDYSYGDGYDGFGWPQGYTPSYSLGRVSDWRRDALDDAADAGDALGDRGDKLLALCREFPDVAAMMLEAMGVIPSDFAEAITEEYGDLDLVGLGIAL